VVARLTRLDFENDADMPEQLTKHPEVTLQVLRSAPGVQCGSDAAAPPAILVQCPPERFCRLPGGELCVYGLADAPRMTQIGAADWRALAGTLHDGTARQQDGSAAGAVDLGAAAALGLLVGLAIAAAHSRWRRGRRSSGGLP